MVTGSLLDSDKTGLLCPCAEPGECAGPERVPSPCPGPLPAWGSKEKGLAPGADRSAPSCQEWRGLLELWGGGKKPTAAAPTPSSTCPGPPGAAAPSSSGRSAATSGSSPPRRSGTCVQAGLSLEGLQGDPAPGNPDTGAPRGVGAAGEGAGQGLQAAWTHLSWMNSSRAAHSDTSWGRPLLSATKDRMGSRSSAPLSGGTAGAGSRGQWGYPIPPLGPWSRPGLPAVLPGPSRQPAFGGPAATFSEARWGRRPGGPGWATRPDRACSQGPAHGPWGWGLPADLMLS